MGASSRLRRWVECPVCGRPGIRRRSGALVLGLVVAVGCGGPGGGSDVLTAEVPLHLEEHLDAAVVDVADPPVRPPEPVEWSFDQPQADWKALDPVDPETDPPSMTRTEDALRIELTEANTFTRQTVRLALRGSIYVDLPDWNRDDWAYVAVRARATGGLRDLTLAFNLVDDVPEDRENLWFQPEFQAGGEYIYAITDGTEQTYLLRADWGPDWGGAWTGGPWRQLGLQVGGVWPGDFPDLGPASIEILSISVIPKGAEYAAAPFGVRTEVRDQAYRRTLFAHLPAGLEFPVLVPEGGRLDLGFGVLRDDVPVTFRVRAETADGASSTLIEETYADKEHWGQRSIDLSHLAGQTVTLSLEATAAGAGGDDAVAAVALWAAPTLSGAPTSTKPNVIFYIIDGGAADHMSAYGYNRGTTPNLERIAAEGALFERAYSNSSWSKTSTPSFMTSLQHSVLGGYWSDNDALPVEAVTMAQHMHRAGYQTAVLTSNPYAATMSSLDRGVDVLREVGVEPSSISSRVLQQDFWRWREAYPAQPYWVHFQTTDVHWPWHPGPPVAGTFVSPQRREAYYEQEARLGHRPAWGQQTADDLASLEIDRAAFFDVTRSLYDEAMAHQDYQLGRFVERLEATGEWDNTLLIVAADHGTGELNGVFDPGLDPNITALFDRNYRIPLIIVWPDRIAPRQRFSDPVSMIDMLPTILDLAGLPLPDPTQGQSLAPLLLGEDGWEPRPVIVDEFYIDDEETGEMSGTLTMIDGRWRAMLDIRSSAARERPEDAPPLLQLYDTWDPFGGRVNDQHPDLVEKYTELLEESWSSHQLLGAQFTRSGDSFLTPEQLRTLRALGYIR